MIACKWHLTLSLWKIEGCASSYCEKEGSESDGEIYDCHSRFLDKYISFHLHVVVIDLLI
jgi:hypothetical protein